MFNKPEGKTEFETVIGPSVKVEGDFVGDGNVFVEGLVNGSLKTANHVQVAEKAKISASITAGSAKIAGEVTGNVTVAERLDLTSTAKVAGDVQAAIISIEAGAKFNGRCVTTDKPSSKETPKQKA